MFGIIFYILGNNTEGHADDEDFGHGSGDDFEYIKRILGSSTGLMKSINWAYRNAIGDIEVPNGK